MNTDIPGRCPTHMHFSKDEYILYIASCHIVDDAISFSIPSVIEAMVMYPCGCIYTYAKGGIWEYVYQDKSWENTE